MPAERVEQFDWSTSLCSIVILPDDPHTPFAEEPYRQRIEAMAGWLRETRTAAGVYQKTVTLTGPGPDGTAGLRVTYRFSDPATARAFSDRFC